MSQLERMESELNALRDLFKSATAEDDAQRMIALSRVILQHEKELSKQKVMEGQTLDKDRLQQMSDDVASAIVEVAMEFLPDKDYHRFVDTLLGRLAVMWSKNA